MSDKTKLLPCPFCGGEAQFERVGTGRQSCIVACADCGARLETGETFRSGASWNSRFTAPTPDPRERGEDAWTSEYRRGFDDGWAALQGSLPADIEAAFADLDDHIREGEPCDHDTGHCSCKHRAALEAIRIQYRAHLALRAPAPSEAVAWMVEFKRTDESEWRKSGPHFDYTEAERDQTRLLLHHWPAHIVPLYTHPAPAREVTEAMPENVYRGNLRYAFARGAMATGAWTRDEALAAAYLVWPDVDTAALTPDAEGGR